MRLKDLRGKTDIWEELQAEARGDVVGELAAVIAFRRVQNLIADVQKDMDASQARVEEADKLLPGLKAASEKAEAGREKAHEKARTTLLRERKGAKWAKISTARFGSDGVLAKAASELRVARGTSASASTRLDWLAPLLSNLEAISEPETALLGELGIG